MELVVRAYSYLTWHFRTFKDMLSSVPVATVAGSGAIVISRFAQLFAFFLPLKVLIMLSSEKVPGLFKHLISAENRQLWLVIFSLATLILYALSVFFATFANRTITRGVNQLLQPQGNLPKEQKKRLRLIYNRHCQASAHAAVFLLGAIGIALINPVVLIGMLFVVAVELWLTGFILGTLASGFIGWIRNGIVRNTNAYIGYLSAVNFLSLFVLLIMDYFIHGNLNVYVAVLTMILGRLTFASLTKFVKSMLFLRNNNDDEEME
jgi:hypothetical protein